MIPNEIGELHSLRILNAKNCSITGNVPRNIGNLTKLEVLGLDKNNLYGKCLISSLNLKYTH